MLEVGWHRSAQLGGDEWWCAAGSSAARWPAPHLHATCSPSWIISGLAVLEQYLSATDPGAKSEPQRGGGVQYCTHTW